MTFVRTLAQGSAVLVLAATVSLFGASTASASPTISVTPSQGLADGQSVSVTASGFTPGASRFVALCHMPTSACDAKFAQPVTVAADGTITATLVVHKQFLGVDPRTETPVGPVDCGAVQCSVGAADLAVTEIAVTPVSFS